MERGGVDRGGVDGEGGWSGWRGVEWSRVERGGVE